MKKTLFLIFFSLGLLQACESERVSDLEQQVQDLKDKLAKATDPETINKLQREIITKQREHIQKKVEEKSKLFKQIEKTENKEDCEKIIAQIQGLEKEIKDLISEYHIGYSRGVRQIGFCGENGYDNTNTSIPPTEPSAPSELYNSSDVPESI